MLGTLIDRTWCGTLQSAFALAGTSIGCESDLAVGKAYLAVQGQK